MREVWNELSGNFYTNYLKIVLWLHTVQYARATGDVSVIYSLYGE